jgi:DNA-binding transcriptional ArsR family regulator
MNDGAQKLGPDIATVAALLGDPARANMLTALTAGQALTAGELAREAGVTAQTASSHLARLTAGGLIVARKQGRHRYYALSGDDVAAVLEGLMGLADRAGHRRARTGPKELALRQARVCYDHLAGDMGVALLDALTAQGRISEAADGKLSLTPQGVRFVASLGLDIVKMSATRRPLCKACLDWSVRRSHLAGSLGAALLDNIYRRGWAGRVSGTRVVSFSPEGLAAFRGAFAIDA